MAANSEKTARPCRAPKLVRRLNLALEVEPAQRPEAAAWCVVRGVECGARTRKNLPCKRPAFPNGRCRNHGGLSTGPRTAEGRRSAAEAARRGRERRAAVRAKA